MYCGIPLVQTPPPMPFMSGGGGGGGGGGIEASVL